LFIPLFKSRLIFSWHIAFVNLSGLAVIFLSHRAAFLPMQKSAVFPLRFLPVFVQISGTFSGYRQWLIGALLC